jgi:hypothetical protein
MAASRAMSASGASATEVVPSDQGRLKESAMLPSGKHLQPVVGHGGRRMYRHRVWRPVLSLPATRVAACRLNPQCSAHSLPPGHRPSERILGDADRGALLRRAGGGRPGGRGSEQAGQQRIFVADGVVADHVDLAIAGSRCQGDEPAPVEEAQDALAGPLDHGLDFVLRWSLGGVEEGGRRRRGQGRRCRPGRGCGNAD